MSRPRSRGHREGVLRCTESMQATWLPQPRARGKEQLACIRVAKVESCLWASSWETQLLNLKP